MTTLGGPLAKVVGESRYVEDDGSYDACKRSWHCDNPVLVIPLDLLGPMERALALALGNRVWGDRFDGQAPKEG